MSNTMFCKDKSASHFFYVLYAIVFLFALFYVVINPEAGRDYHTYLRLVKEINADTYFTEVGFYITVKILTFLWLTPEQIILLLRLLFFLLILRFFYYSSSKFKLLGIVFFLFVPNVFIGSLNALQTWLAISIFMQVFIKNNDGISNKKIFIYSIIAFSFHYFAIVYVLMFISYKYVKIRLKLIFLSCFIIGTQLLKPFILDFFSLFGYLKYLDGEEANVKFLVLSSVFVIIYFVFIFLTDNKKLKKIFFELALALILLVFSVHTFHISGEVLLRTLNFFLLFIWLVIIFLLERVSNKTSLVLNGILIILLVSYFFISIDFNSDMLNLKGFRGLI